MSRTFAAISTAPLNAALGIVRLSGPDAVAVADKVFKAYDKNMLAAAGTCTLHYGRIVSSDGETIDRVMAGVLLAPATFTGFDTVEFTCHGGVVVLGRVFEQLIAAGAAAAEPGEFTKTAFLNGKIDLAESESIIDLINAKSEAAARIASAAVGGGLSARIKELRDSLVAALSHISAFVDFSFEDIVRLDEKELCLQLSKVHYDLKRLASSYDLGKAISQGVPTAIIGRPNVGKSSIMNMLSGRERSIVTELAGTTRDVVTDTVNAGDILLRLADTAGIRNSSDPVEKIGVERAFAQLEGAELVIAVFDGSKQPTDEDVLVIKSISGKNCVIVINKADLPQNQELSELLKDKSRKVSLSAKTGQGFDELIREINAAVSAYEYAGEIIVINARQSTCLYKASEALARAVSALQSGEHSDIAEIDITEAADALGEITGESVGEDVVAGIFARFCVGK